MRMRSTTEPSTSLDAWLVKHLTSLKIPDAPDRKYLEEVGASTYAAKVAEIESQNLMLNPKNRKRIPETLMPLEIGTILLTVLYFRNVLTSSQSNETTLAVYVPADTPFWKKAKRLTNAKGTYVTHHKFFHSLVTAVSIKTTNPKEIEEVIGVIERDADSVAVTTDYTLYPVNNGIYNQQTGVLEPFTPDKVFMTKIGVDYIDQAPNPVVYDPDGTPWDVESWLSELAIDPDVNELLWQVIAASLQPNRGMNKSIWFYSESGNNGKGTMGQLIKNMLGAGNYSSLSVADFNREFHKSKLIGVAANISDENDVDQYIDSVKDYKASVTGDDIIVNIKHKEPVTLQFRGLNIQMMNGLPKTKDKTGSFYRRLIIVPFVKSFTNNGEKSYIKSDYINRKDVLEYVLYKALTLKFDEFIVPLASVELMTQYRKRNNPVLDFWTDMREEFKWDLVPSGFLYDIYQKWFERNSPSGTIIGKQTFLDLLIPIIEADGDWDQIIGTENQAIRPKQMMDDDEPLITEYGLDRPHKNGSPSPWSHPTFRGENAQKKRDFVRKTKYRGILRR